MDTKKITTKDYFVSLVTHTSIVIENAKSEDDAIMQAKEFLEEHDYLPVDTSEEWYAFKA